MRALVYEGPKDMQLREVPVPTPGNDEVVIRVVTAGICGSELSGYLGQNSLRKPPLVMGHEFSGVIAEAGAGVTRFKAGDRVTANPLITCGECRYCKGGNAQLCESRQLLGAHLPGAYAEYVLVKERNVYPLAANVSFSEGALAEPFACAIHTCRLVDLDKHDRLVVFGAGPIGLLAIQAAKLYGASDIAVVDLNEERLDIATKLGATETINPKQSQTVSTGSYDVAIDAVGAQITRTQSVESVRAGGRIGFVGLHEADSSLPINHIIRSEIRTVGSFAYAPADFEQALQWISEGKSGIMPWSITNPLEKGKESFDLLLSNPGNVAKIFLSVTAE